MFLFSDRATPVDFQHADIFGINTYRFTKSDGSFKYVKIHLKTSQGVQNFTASEAQVKAGVDPDFQTRSLYDDIENGGQPSWDVYAQIIDPVVAMGYNINIFDPTKTLPFEDFPLRKFGRIVLNKNVDNFFAEQEQAAFSPTNLVPGWALSPDPSEFMLLTWIKAIEETNVLHEQSFKPALSRIQTLSATVLVPTSSRRLLTGPVTRLLIPLCATALVP